jgi:hypothetical protein
LADPPEHHHHHMPQHQGLQQHLLLQRLHQATVVCTWVSEGCDCVPCAAPRVSQPCAASALMHTLIERPALPALPLLCAPRRCLLHTATAAGG